MGTGRQVLFRPPNLLDIALMIPILIYINDEDRLKFACINAPGSS